VLHQTFAVQFWIRPESAGGSLLEVGPGYALFELTTSKPSLSLFEPIALTSTVTLTKAWTHVAYILDGSLDQLTIYVNQAAAPEDPFALAHTFLDVATNTHETGAGFTGMLWKVCFHNRAYDPSEFDYDSMPDCLGDVCAVCPTTTCLPDCEATEGVK
jgi:hypothetical protein